MLYVNSIASFETCGGQNVRMELNVRGHAGIVYVATKDIEPGGELLTNYGRDYFKMDAKHGRGGSLYVFLLPLVWLFTLRKGSMGDTWR